MSEKTLTTKILKHEEEPLKTFVSLCLRGKDLLGIVV
jgi:hypothetical protein